MYSTIGELIQQYRIQASLSLSQLSRISGVSKGVISKLENGDTKRPELKTIFPISKILNIPIVTIIEYYIEVDERPEVLRELLVEAIKLSDSKLLTKVAVRFLQSSYEQSDIQIKRLYDFVASLAKEGFQLQLYDVIIKYAREHGMQRYLAKGLLQKFLIEMNDMKRMEESFQLGEEVLHYTDFLNTEEKVTFYYQMAFQAHDLEKYDKCIELGKKGHAQDATKNEIKERVSWAICNSYYRKDNLAELEEHLKSYEALGYQFVIERLKYYRAVILSKKGQYGEAIPLLKECVGEASRNNRLHRVNVLLEALLKINDVESVQQLFKDEEKKFDFDLITPYKFSEVGRYYKLKGTFLLANSYFEEGLEAYRLSMNYFAKINAKKDVNEMKAYLQGMIFFGQINAQKENAPCSNDLYAYNYQQNKEFKQLLGKLREVYHTVNSDKSETK